MVHRGRMFGFESRMIRVTADDVFIILLDNESEGTFTDVISNKMMAILYLRIRAVALIFIPSTGGFCSPISVEKN
jgi:hypothetical protein